MILRLHADAARALLIIGALALLGSVARAMPLADYRARVAQADKALTYLLGLFDAAQTDEAQATTAQFKSIEAVALFTLRGALPVKEQVEWAGSTGEVNK